MKSPRQKFKFNQEIRLQKQPGIQADGEGERMYTGDMFMKWIYRWNTRDENKFEWLPLTIDKKLFEGEEITQKGWEYIVAKSSPTNLTVSFIAFQDKPFL